MDGILKRNRRRLFPMIRAADEQGFTLIEVLIALLMGAIVLSAVMTSFLTQHNTYLAQDQVVEMQQNARVAMDMLVRDIRTIGYDPNGVGLGITNAAASTLTFQRDDGSGATETVRYALTDAFASVGKNDSLVDDLGREIGAGGLQPVAENIRYLEFRYLDEDGNATADVNAIRSIQVSMLVQSAKVETKKTPASVTRTTPSGTNWTPDAGYWSLYLTTTVNCRNLGL